MYLFIYSFMDKFFYINWLIQRYESNTNEVRWNSCFLNEYVMQVAWNENAHVLAGWCSSQSRTAHNETAK